MPALSNDQMKPDRYLRWHRARRMVARIVETIDAGGMVTLTTYTRQTRYDRRHRDMFRATCNGAYVQRGKAWDCIDYVAVRHYRNA